MFTLQLTEEQLIEVAKALAVVRYCYQEQAEQKDDELTRACTAQADAWRNVETEIWRQHYAAVRRKGGKR